MDPCVDWLLLSMLIVLFSNFLTTPHYTTHIHITRISLIISLILRKFFQTDTYTHTHMCTCQGSLSCMWFDLEHKSVWEDKNQSKHDSSPLDSWSGTAVSRIDESFQESEIVLFSKYSQTLSWWRSSGNFDESLEQVISRRGSFIVSKNIGDQRRT